MRALRRRGVTLVELLIAMAIFGLIATLIGVLVRSGVTYSRRSQARSELQRASLFLLSQLASELSESSPDCIRYAEGVEPPGIVYATPRGSDGQVTYSNRHLLWKTWVCVWWDEAQGVIFRAQAPLPSPTTFKPDPTPSGYDCSITSMLSSTSQHRPLTRNVSGFSISGGREVQIALEVSLGEGSRRSRLTTRSGIRPHH